MIHLPTEDIIAIIARYSTRIRSFAHRWISFCFRERKRPKPAGPVVDRLVHRFVRRFGRFLPDRQLFRVVLPSWWTTADRSVRATSGSDERASDRNTTPALSPVRTAVVRFRELRWNRGQNVRWEVGHLRDIGADSQTRGPGASLGSPPRERSSISGGFRDFEGQKKDGKKPQRSQRDRSRRLQFVTIVHSTMWTVLHEPRKTYIDSLKLPRWHPL